MSIRAEQHFKQERADAKAFAEPSLSWAGHERWYAIRTAPGTQRSPSLTGDLPQQRRKDDCSIIERNLRNEGIDVFMPCIRRDVIHHRTRKWIDKRFPLLVGYVFVNLPKGNFGKVEGVDGVSGFVRPGNSRFAEPLVTAVHRIRDGAAISSPASLSDAPAGALGGTGPAAAVARGPEETFPTGKPSRAAADVAGRAVPGECAERIGGWHHPCSGRNH